MRRRTLSPRGALVVDLLLVLLAGTTGAAREIYFPPNEVRMLDLPLWVYVATQIVGALTLIWRRHAPLTVGLANAALCLVSPTQASYVVAYSLGAHAASRARAIAVYVVMVGCWILGAQLWNLRDMVSAPVMIVLFLLIGLYVQARRSLYDALAERVVRAEREQDLLAAQAVSDERDRLTRDMHDTISHRLSMMVLQAGALSVSVGDSTVRQSAESIRSTGVAALDDLRELIDRMDHSIAADEEHEHLTTAPAIGGLIDDARAAGLNIEVEQRGRDEMMSPTVARTIYRVVQEALTNVVKHAPGSRVTVELRHSVAGTRLTVHNSAPRSSTDDRLGSSGGGRGLDGLRQRVEMVGGRLTTDQEDDGGFRLIARIPARVSQEGTE